MITLIAYRPNGADYCMGCKMDSSESEHEVSFHYNTQEAGAKLATYHFADYEQRNDRAVYDWEITILYKGEESEEMAGYVERDAKADTKNLIAEYEKSLTKIKHERQQKDHDFTRARELRQLKELQSKHPEA